MNKNLSLILRTAAVATTLSLPLLAAASPAQPGEAITVDGQIQKVNVDPTHGSAQKALAIVSMSGQLYLLKPSADAPKAFQAADRMAGRDDWFKVRGIVTKKDGTLALSVQNVRKI